jgi:hypothetical protein
MHLSADVNKSVVTVSNPSGDIISMYYPFGVFVVAETKRIRATVKIPDGFHIDSTWTWANSYSGGYEWGNPSYGIPRATKISQNGRDVTFEMYCYRMKPVGGSTLNWYPSDPNSADINVSIFGKYTPVIAPIISNFTQTPNPLYRGNSGYVTCNLSQGNGSLNYRWSIVYDNTGFSISDTTCETVSIHYSNTDAIAQTNSENISYPKDLSIEAPTGAVLQCKVWNSAGTDSVNVFINLATTPHGCPFVYT